MGGSEGSRRRRRRTRYKVLRFAGTHSSDQAASHQVRVDGSGVGDAVIHVRPRRAEHFRDAGYASGVAAIGSRHRWRRRISRRRRSPGADPAATVMMRARGRHGDVAAVEEVVRVDAVFHGRHRLFSFMFFRKGFLIPFYVNVNEHGAGEFHECECDGRQQKRKTVRVFENGVVAWRLRFVAHLFSYAEEKK